MLTERALLEEFAVLVEANVAPDVLETLPAVSVILLEEGVAVAMLVKLADTELGVRPVAKSGSGPVGGPKHAANPSSVSPDALSISFKKQACSSSKPEG